MNLRRLAYIVAIADEGNVSAAAGKLFISRPALNHYLISLEEELGVPLFKRLQKTMVPTDAGSIYINAAREILEIQKQTYKRLQALSENKIGTLNVGVNYGREQSIFNNIFPLFHKEYPEFIVNVKLGSAEELETAILKGEIDFALAGWLGLTHPTLQHIIYRTTEILLVLPPDHPLAKKAAPPGQPYHSIDLHLLKDEKFILKTKETRTRQIIDNYLTENDFAPKSFIECRLGQMAYEMVKSGSGVAFLYEDELPADDTLPKFSLSPKLYWKYSIVYRQHTHFTQAEKFFLRLCFEKSEIQKAGAAIAPAILKSSS
ncbi:MAG: LysR family transcriptional regulator [Lachnospiraceae bacterium]|nr:LysR family transcriptional regulator [Lachnospiraceae bacterium]